MSGPTVVAPGQVSSSTLRDGAAAELKQGQYSLLCLRVGALDIDAVQSWVADQVAAAPRLLTGAAVALELDTIAEQLQSGQLEDLQTRLRFCGLKPVAVVGASDSALGDLAEAAGLPMITAWSRGNRSTTAEHAVPAEHASSKDDDTQSSSESAADQHASAAQPEAAPAQSQTVTAAPAAAAAPIQHNLRSNQPVRSGQQLYARGGDLVLTATVSAGAEVIADGCIHVYGRLSGKALAGALGDTSAQIYCLAFDAELVSIAGRFRVFESVPAELKGKACHLYLNGDRLEIQPLH